ncbi:FRIGIDA-like protein [Euphorbia peplus]|nr:FRIGIDA-like protein [Euphorbia peplus]
MEKIAEHLKQATVIQESIWKSIDEVNIDSPCILSLTRQWRDVQDQLELAKFSLEKHGQKLDLKAKKIAKETRVLDQRDKEVEREKARLDGLQSENKHISVLSEKIMYLSLELISKEKELNLARKDVEDFNEMIRTKMGELELVLEKHEEYNKELTLMMKQVRNMEKSIEEQNEELKLNESKLGMVKMKLEERCKDLSVKNDQLESVQKSLQVRCIELELKEKEVENVRISSENLDIEIELKEKELISKKQQLSTIANSIEERKTEFQLEDNKLRSTKEELGTMKKEQLSLQKSITDYCEQLETMKQQQLSLEKSIIDCSKEVESKKKNLDLVKTSLKDLTSREAEVNSMQRKNCEFHKKLKEKEKSFDALEKAFKERSTKLDMKEKQFQVSLKELELKEHQIDAIYRSRQALESFEQKSHIQAHGQEYPATAKCQSSTSIDQYTSPLILPSEMGDCDLTPNEVLSVLRSSPDPADFVLSLMQGSYSQQDANVKTRNLILEKLIAVSPTINPVVQTKAVELAFSWKETLSSETEKAMEVWSFLLFLAAYKLVRYFGGEEILKHVLVAASQRNAPNICQLLDFTDKIPEMIERLMERKQHIEAARFSSAFGLLHKFPLESILQNCVEHIKGKAIDEELSALKAIVQCISDYKLELKYNAQNIARRICELEMEKQCRRSRPTTFSLLQKNSGYLQNFRDQLQPGGGNNKRPRINNLGDRFINSTGLSRNED